MRLRVAPPATPGGTAGYPFREVGHWTVCGLQYDSVPGYEVEGLLGLHLSSRSDQIGDRLPHVPLARGKAARRARFPDLLGSVYLFQGRNDEALTEWRIAFENGWRGMPNDVNREYIDLAPFAKFDSVRDDPRFRALIDDIRADLDRQRRALERDGLAIAR